MVRKNSLNTIQEKNMCRISTRAYVENPSQKNTYRLRFQSAVEKIGNFLWKSPFSCPNIGNKVRRKGYSASIVGRIARRDRTG